MFIATVPNRGSPPAILLRESYRQSGKVKTRTLANITGWPQERIEAVRAALRVKRGQIAAAPVNSAFQIVRARPHGHVAAVLGTLRRTGLEGCWEPSPAGLGRWPRR